MTNTDNTELREQIIWEISTQRTVKSKQHGYEINADRIMQLIARHTEEAVREARIDELERNELMNTKDILIYVIERIAQLKERLEERT